MVVIKKMTSKPRVIATVDQDSDSETESDSYIESQLDLDPSENEQVDTSATKQSTSKHNTEADSDDADIDSDNDDESDVEGDIENDVESNDDAVESGDDAVESNNDAVDSNDDAVESNDDAVESNSDSVKNDSLDASESDEDHEAEIKSENEALLTNEGWADSVAKILGTNKPKNKKTLVLSRAKKHSEVINKEKKEVLPFEIEGPSEDVKPDVKVKEDPDKKEQSRKRKLEIPSLRVKPDILEKDRERILAKIATKGVVQLFNAVKNQQKSLQDEVEGPGLSEAKKEKIMKSFDKRTFLDKLMGPTKSTIVDEQTKKFKTDIKDEDKPKWNALRDDFMMGAKMKDWDKETTDT